MANSEHLAKLKRNVPDWNKWRATVTKDTGISRAHLSRTDLSEADLATAKLGNADLAPST